MNDLVSALNAVVPEKHRSLIAFGVLALPYLTRALHALVSGRGLVGIFSGVLFGTNTPTKEETAAPVKITTLSLLICVLTSLSVSVLLCACANVNRNVYEAENTATDAVSAARHTFNVWLQQEMASATAAGNTNRVAELNRMRDYVHDQVYHAGMGLAVVDTVRLEVATNNVSTNQSALTIAIDSLPIVSSNITWAVKYFMSGGSVATPPPPAN